jgi:hypothetical protein
MSISPALLTEWPDTEAGMSATTEFWMNNLTKTHAIKYEPAGEGCEPSSA